MKYGPGQKSKANWLFRGLIGVSLIIHIVIFMHISGFYQTSALSFIEMTLDDISKPFSRDIPRPRIKQKHEEKPRDVKKLHVRQLPIPKFNIDPVDKNLNDALTEDISIPKVPDVSSLGIADWNPVSEVNYTTPDDYYEMVRLRIESRKRYPDSARLKHIEGRTTVRFVIDQDGKASDVEVIQAARYQILNGAALEAVKKASPFPRPPAHLFKGPLHMELTILFELT
ncbi:TonB related protein [uncultured Desulfobacterium sp.]|uniref:TonB related protein n=1 Tax=uncultured Desulfobacterium sp. TaxID=201089 RepID=A0A445MTQ0_9BACT|nr:TonB related protein [uncultured Desulfobacterium sp.]